jgi:hypothetical protein
MMTILKEEILLKCSSIRTERGSPLILRYVLKTIYMGSFFCESHMLHLYHLGNVSACIVHCSGIKYYILFNNFILFESYLNFWNCWEKCEYHCPCLYWQWCNFGYRNLGIICRFLKLGREFFTISKDPVAMRYVAVPYTVIMG